MHQCNAMHVLERPVLLARYVCNHDVGAHDWTTLGAFTFQLSTPLSLCTLLTTQATVERVLEPNNVSAHPEVSSNQATHLDLALKL